MDTCYRCHAQPLQQIATRGVEWYQSRRRHQESTRGHRKNKTVSDLNIGDKVRKNLLFNDKNSKGTDPKWSGKVFTVVKIYGNTIRLDVNSKYKRMFLLKVSEDAEAYSENVII